LHALMRFRGRSDANVQGWRVARAPCLRDDRSNAVIRARPRPRPHF
jgi:hypothetical protein